MTKVIILSQESKEEKKSNPIKFNKFLISNDVLKSSNKSPADYDYIELICRNYIVSGEDLMFAYNKNRNAGVLYIGHFNDGVIE